MDLVSTGRLPKNENLKLSIEIYNVYEGKPFYNLSVYNVNTKTHKYGSYSSEYTCVFDTDGYDLSVLFKELKKSRYSGSIDTFVKEMKKVKFCEIVAKNEKFSLF